MAALVLGLNLMAAILLGGSAMRSKAGWRQGWRGRDEVLRAARDGRIADWASGLQSPLMATGDNEAFAVEVGDDGAVTVRGSAAVAVLLRLVMAAKFQTELTAEHLLSPYVDSLLDRLTSVTPVEPVDWSNSAIITPPCLLEALDVVREYRDRHEGDRDLEELLRVALKPFDPPLERLGLG